MKYVDQPVLRPNYCTTDRFPISTFGRFLMYFDIEADAYSHMQKLVRAHPPNSRDQEIGKMHVFGVVDVEDFVKNVDTSREVSVFSGTA